MLQIIDARREESEFLLPPLLENDRVIQKTNTNLPHLMLDKLAVAECLQSAGMEHNRVQTGMPYSLNQIDQSSHRHSWVETTPLARDSLHDISNYSNDIDSVSSSPGVSKVIIIEFFYMFREKRITHYLQKLLLPEYNFEAMKRVLAEPTEASKREEREKQIQIGKVFKESKFEDLIRRTEPKHDMIQNKLNELFNSLAAERQMNLNDNKQNSLITDESFPELFFH